MVRSMALHEDAADYVERQMEVAELENEEPRALAA
jgi:hypothetical protein